jgi:pentose-5-phosphate-3-epimerase
LRPFGSSDREKARTAQEKNTRFRTAKSRLSAFNERLCPSTKEDVMRKALSIAAFLTAMAVSPAFAASELCTDAHMQKMDKMIAEMSDAAAKKQATMHLDMSKAEMKKGNEAGCLSHMQEVHKAMGL